MPTSRSLAEIDIKDRDRNLDFTLTVGYDALADGAIERPRVISVQGTVWFGKFGAEMDCGHNDLPVRRFIESKYANEILEAIRDYRQRLEAE